MSLASAIIYGDKSTVEEMLRNGADVDEIDEYGFRPLVEAAITNKNDIAELLLNYGADVQQKDATGRSALHWSIENSNLALSQLLLKHGADANSYTLASQPALTYPLLRNQNSLKNLLYDYKANLSFAQDYINTKLLGHRFELIGQTDIVNHKGEFIELDFEGFFLEFTLSIVGFSLQRYRNHFAAKKMRRYFNHLKRITDSFSTAAKLIRYQHYTVNIKEYSHQIEQLLENEPLIIPVAHRGHAITFIKYGNLFVKCDRGENSKTEGSINVYRIHRRVDYFELAKQLMYVRQQKSFIDEDFKKLLQLEHLWLLPLSSQITGNCSWANVEAAIPTIMFLLLADEVHFQKDKMRDCIDHALDFYQRWLRWDQDRALYDCISNFEEATPARKASKAAVLGAVLFQHCQYLREEDTERVEKILTILNIREYRYVLESYLNIYWRRQKTIPGQNLVNLLDVYGMRV